MVLPSLIEAFSSSLSFFFPLHPVHAFSSSRPLLAFHKNTIQNPSSLEKPAATPFRNPPLIPPRGQIHGEFPFV